MSEEIKSLKNYISTTKNEIFTTFKIETISNLIIYYEDLQQKLKSISKRIRKAIDNDDDDLLYVLFDIQDIIQDDEEQKLAYDRYIKPYIE